VYSDADCQRIDFVGCIDPPISDLLCDFEDDIEFYRHPERKAGDADHQPNRHLLGTKDSSKQVRDSIRDSGLVKEVAEVAMNTPSRTTRVTRSSEPRWLFAAARTPKAAVLGGIPSSFSIEFFP
jgi:hypothetical protein